MSESFIEKVAAKTQEVCRVKGWKRNWSNGGCYLHLEVSEFIEALRGKGQDSPAEEAADILFILLSMLRAHDISPAEVLQILDKKCDDMLAECRCSYEDSDEMTRHARLCPVNPKNVPFMRKPPA